LQCLAPKLRGELKAREKDRYTSVPYRYQKVACSNILPIWKISNKKK
jgi:hypothetical protein